MPPEPNHSPKLYCINDTLYQSVHSTIYQAYTHHHPKQNVVIKCFEADAQEAYLREMAGFGMKHPNLIEYLDTFYLDHDDACIVYPWYPLTLEKWLSENGHADEDFCFVCLEAILEALIYLNQQGRIHCDIKPHNVFLQFDTESQPQFVLGDLGSTCSLQEAQETRYTVSTPAYLAPERLYKNFYLNSDLYSLGVLAYELAVGSRPYHGTLEEITKAHLSKQPALEAIPFPKLRDFIGQLMEKNPVARIGNAEVALYMLRSIRYQHDVAICDYLKNLPESPQSQPDIQSIIPFGFFEKSQFSIAYAAKKIMAFPISDQLAVAFEYDNYIELAYGKNTKLRLLMKMGAVQALDDGSFVYANGNKLIRYDVAYGSQQCLYRFKEQVDFFYFDDDYLLFGNKYRNTYLNLQVMQPVQFSQQNYLAENNACIFDDGSFCMSGGPCNQDIVWRDKETQPLGQWQLDGPIIGITHASRTALILTIDLHNESKYVMWAVTLDGAPKKITLTDKVQLYHQTQGYFFWLTYDNHLFLCGIDLSIILLGTLPIKQEQVKAFYFSYDHRWLVVLTSRLDNENRVYCYQTHGA